MSKLPTMKKLGGNEKAVEWNEAALNALPEPIFLLNVQTAALTPLNAAAKRWSGGILHHDDGSIDSAACFPELDLAAIASTSSRTWFTHCMDSATNQPCEVELQLHPLGGDGRQQIVVVRPISVLPGDELLLHGATNGAFHDPLTGLPNRRLFIRRLKRAIERANRGDYHFAVLFVDLDNFKRVNDRFGHISGDQLLVAVGRRLLETVRPQDMVARRDGDEFTILLDDLEQPDDAQSVAQRIVDQLQTPLPIAGGGTTAEVTVGASIGIALSGSEALTAEEMLARADAAMYHAKALGGGTYMMLDCCAQMGGTGSRQGKPLPR